VAVLICITGDVIVPDDVAVTHSVDDGTRFERDGHVVDKGDDPNPTDRLERFNSCMVGLAVRVRGKRKWNSRGRVRMTVGHRY